MNQDKQPRKQTKPRRKKRRLKKSVRRGCLGFFATLLLLIVFTIYECTRPCEAEAPVPEVALPVLPPDGTDSLVAEAVMRKALTSPCIDTSRLAISIFDIDRRCTVIDHHGQTLMAPASCMKLLTAIAAFHRLGVNHEYVSRLSYHGRVEEGTLWGDVILDMDDDPLILTFEEFAAALAEHGIRAIEGQIIYNLACRDTLRQHPTAAPWDIPYGKVPLLMKGEKRVEREFEQALTACDVAYHPNPAPAAEGETVTCLEVRHPMREVMAPMLIHSSNVKAECIFRHLHRLSTPSGLSPLRQFLLEEVGDAACERYTINDGSGLSPENRLTSDLLVRLMDYAFRQDSLRTVLIDEALATPGDPIRHGSLLGRMSDERFLGRIYCKTGTLTTIGSSSLTGYAHGADGRWFAFSIITADTPVADSRILQDAICRILVSQ